MASQHLMRFRKYLTSIISNKYTKIPRGIHSPWYFCFATLYPLGQEVIYSECVIFSLYFCIRFLENRIDNPLRNSFRKKWCSKTKEYLSGHTQRWVPKYPRNENQVLRRGLYIRYIPQYMLKRKH